MLGRKEGVPQLLGHDPRLGSRPQIERSMIEVADGRFWAENKGFPNWWVTTPDWGQDPRWSRFGHGVEVIFLYERDHPPPQKKKNKKNSLLAEKCRTPNIRLCVSGEGVTTPAPTPTPLPWASWGTTSVVPENGGGLRVMDGDVNGVVVNNLADT